MRTNKELIWLPTGGHIGDAVMVSSLFAELVRLTPELHIYYVVRRNGPLLADLVRAYPQVTVVFMPQTPVKALLAVLPLFARRSLVAMLPSCDAHPRVIKVLCVLFWIRGDTIVGYRDGSRWSPYTVVIDHDKHVSYIDSIRQALSAVHLPTEPIGTPPQLVLHSSLSSPFPFEKQPYILIHPFPHMSTRKTLPLRRWRVLIEKLRRHYPTYGIVITGGEADIKSANVLKADDSNIFLAVQCSLLEEAGLIEHAALYIGVDTGPTHIAGVLNAPSVILAQQSEPAWLPSYNPNAVLLWDKEHCRCGILGTACEEWEDGNPYRRCVYYVSDEAILAAVDSKITSPKSSVQDNFVRQVPVGDAAFIDNESILATKERNFLHDPEKLAHVRLERSQYRPGVETLLNHYPEIQPLYDKLAYLHGELWRIEERKRQIEHGQPEDLMIDNLLSPGSEPLLREYLMLCRQISKYNDLRASLKKEINGITGSTIIEVKSHKDAQ